MIQYTIDQFMHMFHYFVSLLLILVLCPRFIFKNDFKEGLERIITDFIKMSLLVIVLGYALVLFQLFELMSIVFLLILIAIKIRRMQQKRKNMEESMSNFEALIYDYFDGRYKLRQLFFIFSKQVYDQFKEIVSERFSTRTRTISTISLLGVLIFAIYIRFYEAVLHAAPSYGNRYSTLKWVKDIRENMLFSDGVMPQGFYVFWATIQEFSRIDTLHMAKYTGPFIQILIIVGIYFFLSRILGNRVSGVVGVVVYTLLGQFMDPNYWQWQVEADLRTFVIIFFLPTVYFLAMYLREASLDAYRTMFAGMAVIAFVHPFMLIYLLIALIIVSMYLTLTKRKKDQSPISKVFLCWIIACGMATIPIVVGFIWGKPFHISMSELFGRQTESPFFITETPSMVPLIVSVAIGLIWFSLFQWFSKYKYHHQIQNSMLVILIVISLFSTSLQPVDSIKVDWDAGVNEYVHISSEYEPRNWMVVSKDSFAAIVRGRGHHMNINDFASNYDPSKVDLTRNNENRPDLNLAAHVFIIYEKELRNKEGAFHHDQLFFFYERWEQEMQDLEQWLQQYIDAHKEIEILHEDEKLVIYYLEREQSREEIQTNIWGEVD